VPDCFMIVSDRGPAPAGHPRIPPLLATKGSGGLVARSLEGKIDESV